MAAEPEAAALVVKLGGAALTHKSQVEALNAEAVRVLSEALRAHAPLRQGVVVVHGAGSFGHFFAKQHGLARGVSPGDAAATLGLARTRHSVATLNRAVVGALVEAGVAAVSVSPGSLVGRRGGALDFAPLRAHVEALLRMRLTPVLHGDVVLDAETGCAVLSGDRILQELALALRPRRAVFVTDVDGVFDADPARGAAQRIALMRVVDGRIAMPRTAAAEHDVTGGMRAKLEAAEAVAAAGVEVAVVGFRGGAALAEALSLAELRSGGTRIAAAERA